MRSRFLLLALSLATLHAADPWWRREPLRIIDVTQSLTGDVASGDPAAIASAKAALGFNMEHLDVMRIAGGLDDEHFYFVSQVAGKQNIDFLKTYLPEAHKRGIRVLIYFDVHWYSLKFAAAHPEWRQIRENGKPLDGVYDTGADFCVNTAWRKWCLQVLRDLAAYPIDGIFYDGPVYRPDTCYCAACREKYRQKYAAAMPRKSERQGADFARLLEFQAGSIADFLRDSRQLLKSINPEIAFYMNSGARGANWATGRLNRIIGPEQDILGSEGGFLAGDLTRLPLWKPSLTARLLETQAPDKPRVIFSAAGQKPWSFSLLPAAELRLLYASTIANGANIWFGVTPFDMGQPEMQALADMNRFVANHSRYYLGTKPAAKVAIVWSDTTANFYAGAGAQLMDIDTVKEKSAAGNLEAEFTGISEGLLRAHIPFEVIDDVTLERENIARYSAIFLPNVACMSDASARRIADYVQAGGHLFSTFETSLYDETGIRRTDFALRNVLGGGTTGKVIGPMRWDFMQPSGVHPLLTGLQRELDPASIYHVQVAAPDALLYFTKPLAGRYDGVPPVSTDAALLRNSLGSGTSVYFSGDLGASIEGFHIPELLRLVANAATQLGGTPPVRLSGAPGSVELVVRTQGDARTLVHLVNFTGEMTRPMQSIVPLNDLSIEAEGRFRSAHTLYHPRPLAVSIEKNRTTVKLPRLNEYEVVVLER